MSEPKMDETVPGGRYKGANGTWHDANGKILPGEGEVVAQDNPGEEKVPAENVPQPATEPQTAEQLSAEEKKAAAKKAAAEKAAAAKATKAAKAGKPQ